MTDRSTPLEQNPAPSRQAVMFSSLSNWVTYSCITRGKLLCAEFIIIMIYYYDPSLAEQLVKPQ